MRDDALAAALAAVHQADADVETANEEARRIQREAGDARALAIARLVDLAGRQGAADHLETGLKAIDKATGRARQILSQGGPGRSRRQD